MRSVYGARVEITLWGMAPRAATRTRRSFCRVMALRYPRRRETFCTRMPGVRRGTCEYVTDSHGPGLHAQAVTRRVELGAHRTAAAGPDGRARRHRSDRPGR